MSNIAKFKYKFTNRVWEESNMKRRSKVVLWILGVVISILLVTIGGIYSYGNHLFNKIEKI